MLKYNGGTLAAIIFASVVISGSLVFFGLQMRASGEGDISSEQIERGIEAYIQKQQQDQQEATQKAMADKNVIAQNVKPVSQAEDHIRGSVDASISLIEFSDFECPFCKRFHSTAQQVVDEYEGQVNWVYRHFPLEFHDPLATTQAVATECANEQGGNDAFWAMADAIFDTTTSNGGGMDPAGLLELAEAIGLERQTFEACLSSGRYDDHIQSDIADGRNAGVTGTPGSVLLNHQTGETVLTEGAQDISVFREAIDAMLKS